MKKKKIKKNSSVGPRPYKKCLQLVIKMTEDFIDFGDCTDDLLDQIADLKKRLNSREQCVISKLASLASPLIVEIDEATGGGELSIKV